MRNVPPVKVGNMGEFRVMQLREIPNREATLASEPEEAVQYWKANIITDAHYRPEVEQFFCLVVNTRRRVTGHYLVALGT